MPGPARYMADLSNNNRLADPLAVFRAYYKAGHRVIALKATEGVGGRQAQDTPSTDSPRSSGIGRQVVYPDRVHAAHQAGLTVIHYHFARPDHHRTPEAEAHDFLSYIKPHYRKGDKVALDLEVQPIPGLDLNGYAAGFANLARRAVGAQHGWLYSYTAFIAQHHLRTPKGWRLWLANYSAPVPHPGAWTHQYTDGHLGPGPHKLPGVGVADVSLMTRRAALGFHINPR